MKVFRHLYFYHDLSENIIDQKKNGMNGNILRVCRCFNKKSLITFIREEPNQQFFKVFGKWIRMMRNRLISI